MSEVTSAQNELSEVDQLYKRLAASDTLRPGEWARRKVQAYAAQQAAERSLRESAEARGNSVAGASSVARGSAAAPVPRAASVDTAVKKPLVKPLVLVVAFVAVAV